MSKVKVTPEADLQNFLAVDSVQKGLKIVEIKNGLKQVNVSEKETFKRSMETAEYIGQAVLWYGGEDGKIQRKLDNIKFNITILAREVFDLGKTQFYEYNNCYKAHMKNDKILKEYVKFVEMQKKAGENEKYTLLGFLRYANEEETGEDEDLIDYPTKFVTGKGKAAIKCRMTSDDVIDLQGNSIDDVLNVAEHLVKQLLKMMAKGKAKAKAPVSASGKELFEALGMTSEAVKGKAKAKAKSKAKA